jgi:ABC-2 type transport system ATP-binding protein
MSAIEISGLRKVYEVGFLRKSQKVGLKDLSLQVEEGEVFGCLGPNGAGKSTTLKLLMGLMYPTSGSMKIVGREIDDPVVKASIGFLPEHPYFYDYLSAPELLEYFAQLSGVAAGERAPRAKKMLERVGLADVGSMQLRKFSKGMLQRVGIAQAIIHDPKIVFLDEPMSGLDPVGRREVRDLIQSLNDEGKTVFFSTHILSDAEALCDRVAVLHKGELRGVEVIANLLAKARGKIEIICEGESAAEKLTALGAECRKVGQTVRAVLDDSQQERAIDALRASGGRLLSLTPVHGTLEEYFLNRIDARAAEVQQ